MKKIIVGLMLTLLLSGCGAKETLETVADDIPLPPVMAEPAEISVRLPDNAVSPVLESDTEQVYLSEDYEITIETRSSGDIGGTITALTGFDPEQRPSCTQSRKQQTAMSSSGYPPGRTATGWAGRWCGTTAATTTA